MRVFIEFVSEKAKRTHNRRAGHIDKAAISLTAVEIENFLKLIEKGRVGFAELDTLQHRREHRCLHAACRTLSAAFTGEELRDPHSLGNHARIFRIETHDAAADGRTCTFE